jgi:hypothetical protein
MVPRRMPDPRSLINSTALSFSSQSRLFRITCFLFVSGEKRCLIPRHLTLVHNLSSCRRMLSMFIVCTSAPCRDRAVVLPEGSPICTVPPPSCPLLTSRCLYLSAVAHQADGEVAVEVHPVHRHERQQMADVKGGRGRVDTDVDAYALLGEEPVERLAAAVRNQHCSGLFPRAKTYPATSLTKPRSSSTLSMLCCAPVRILPAFCSHSACRAASSADSAAHRFFGRSPRARLCWLRMHCRQTYCRRCDTCLSINIAANGSGAKRDFHLESDDQSRTDCGFPEHLRTMHVTCLPSPECNDIDFLRDPSLTPQYHLSFPVFNCAFALHASPIVIPHPYR